MASQPEQSAQEQLSASTPAAQQAPPAEAPKAPASLAAVPTAAAPRAPRGRWLAPACAVLALAAAAVALTAPALRPIAIEKSNAWLGPANPLAGWLTDDDAAARDLASLAPRLAALEQEVRTLRSGLRGLDQRLGEAASQMQEGLGSVDSIARQAQEATQRAALAEAAAETLGVRVRAATMIAIGTRLRRNVDAGAAIGDDVALLVANAPYPAPIAAAVTTLERHQPGVRTMRDLATGYEAMDSAIVAATGLDAGWQSRPWLRLRSLFGAGPEQMMASEAALLERIRGLANQGRFADAAAILATSPWRSHAEDWIAQVSARTAVVQAVQQIAGYALGLAQAVPAPAQRIQ